MTLIIKHTLRNSPKPWACTEIKMACGSSTQKQPKPRTKNPVVFEHPTPRRPHHLNHHLRLLPQPIRSQPPQQQPTPHRETLRPARLLRRPILIPAAQPRPATAAPLHAVKHRNDLALLSRHTTRARHTPGGRLTAMSQADSEKYYAPTVATKISAATSPRFVATARSASSGTHTD